MPMSYSEGRSMFPPYKFDYASYAEGCIKRFGVKPRPQWISTEFGGHVSYSYVLKLQDYYLEKQSSIILSGGLFFSWNFRK